MARKTEKGGKFRNVHCRTWNMARKLKIIENEKYPLDAPPDSQSTDVPKNGSSGPRSQGPQRYGNRFVRTQEAVREATQEDPQGWTCVPPPTSY